MLNSHPTVVLTDRKKSTLSWLLQAFYIESFDLYFTFSLQVNHQICSLFEMTCGSVIDYILIVYNIFHILHDNHFIQRHIIVCYRKYKYTCFANEYKIHVAYVICTLLTFVMFLLLFSNIYIGVD